MRRLLVFVTIATAALAACLAPIDYSGTEYQCPDGITCPSGFECVRLVCRVSETPPDEPDAGPPGTPDGAPPIDRPDGDIVTPPGPDAALPEDDMVPVAAGAFLRGCTVFAGDDCRADTEPQRSITLSAFSIDVHEVTQGEFATCVAAGKCQTPDANWHPSTRPDHPVTDVSWNDAVDYCEFVGKRLPSEAEWEKAARGTDGRRYPWGATKPACALASFDQCDDAPVEVGSHPGDESPYGAREMAGNVTEWVADYYGSGYYDTSPDVDPTGPSSGDKRVVRGGDWESVLEFLRTFDRDKFSASTTNDFIGFRCARSTPP
jgi:formylglycine-generating enzyme required for sulfatase activity